MLILEKFVAPEATDLGDDLSDVPETSVFRGDAYQLGYKLMSSAYDFGGTDDYGLSLGSWRNLCYFVVERRFGSNKNMRAVAGERESHERVKRRPPHVPEWQARFSPWL